MQDNTNQPIFIGKITEFGSKTDQDGNICEARVAPITSPDAPTRLFPINYTCRGQRCDLQIDTQVWCARAENGEGIILARADGEYTKRFPGDVKFENGDVKADDISLKEHIHQGVHGPTSPPQ